MVLPPKSKKRRFCTWGVSLTCPTGSACRLVSVSLQMVKLVQAGFTSFDGADHYGMHLSIYIIYIFFLLFIFVDAH